jgi:hypothetical protein
MNTVSRSWPGERQQSELEGVRHASIDLTVGIAARDRSLNRRDAESTENLCNHTLHVMPSDVGRKEMLRMAGPVSDTTITAFEATTA